MSAYPIMSSLPHSSYTGRFAPSPSGQLHFGSLIAAVASYLDARVNQGVWRVRMEDIDAPRCVEGADSAILDALACHGLQWDGDVLYQQRRHDAYHSVVESLLSEGKAYYCTCTRKMIQARGGVYNGKCRYADNGPQGASVRLKLDDPVTRFTDRLLGDVTISDAHALEDTVLKRRDGLFSYNLVVVLDDIFQQVSDIVRGSDLLTTTAAHLSLYRQLGAPAPGYMHLPVAAVEPGRKLSKQNRATPLDLKRPAENLRRALVFLGAEATLLPDSPNPEDILAAGLTYWRHANVPKLREIIVPPQESTYHSEP